ncbi:uncharacterized protein LOC113205982 isoform X2 [Frankliniella occidentalis]|uniref:Uncharacterized protein LOC113205982 isoform X2 n=1 Tax=Frankliniella occidentalis TaxID=133901 RepID=A0A9C6U9V2_FRAOC|nr:uncharacterized protein LOC113205982 isoform X2 [Frankliniella occidentalis]
MAELLSLPDEILLMILGYCSSVDYVLISRVCRKLNDILCDQKLCRVINFHYETNLPRDFKSFLTFRPRAANIITIDLTSCYWLTSSFIRDLLSRLRNLENVLVADTTLSAPHLRSLLLSLPRVKRLSWTWKNTLKPGGLEVALKRLEFLYLCVFEYKALNRSVHLINKCENLKELWINNIHAISYLRSDDTIALNHLESIVSYPYPSWPSVTVQSKLKDIWHTKLPSLSEFGLAVNPGAATSSLSNKRISRVTDDLEHGVETPFRKMIGLTPLVEVFEIGVSGETHSFPKMPIYLQWDLPSLSSLRNWAYLKSLTLANLPIKNGKFFATIFKDCKILKSLKIVDLGPEAICVYAQDLYNALPFCSALEDFHWTQNYVLSTTKLWMALQQIRTIRRIALCLQGMSDVIEKDVSSTMEKCPFLFFLHIATCTSKANNNFIKNKLRTRWSKDRPHISVWFGQPGEFFDSDTCPIVHSGEMVQDLSRVEGVPKRGVRFLSFGEKPWAPHI